MAQPGTIPREGGADAILAFEPPQSKAQFFLEGVRGGDVPLWDGAAAHHLGTRGPVLLELGVNAETRRFSEPGAGIQHAGIFGGAGG